MGIQELRQDLVVLNERQDQIIKIFGQLAQAKYEINRSPPSSSTSSISLTPSSSTPPSSSLHASKLSHSVSADKGKGKGEVFVDVKWKPMVLAHGELVKSFSKIPKAYRPSTPPPHPQPPSSQKGVRSGNDKAAPPSSTPSSTTLPHQRSIPSLPEINFTSSHSATTAPPHSSSSSSLPLSATRPNNASTKKTPSKDATTKESKKPGKKKQLHHKVKSTDIDDVDDLLNELEDTPKKPNFYEWHFQRWSKRVLSSSVAKYLLSSGRKDFGRLNGEWKKERDITLKPYEDAVVAIDPDGTGKKPRKEKGPSLSNIAYGIPINEWDPLRPLKRFRKSTRTRRFVTNSPKFFTFNIAPIPISGAFGFTRSEMRKAVDAAVARGIAAGTNGLLALTSRGSSGNLLAGDVDTIKSSKSRSKKETRLRAVISSLDEKLRDLKNKYAEEMRRSLHIQSELMKAESEKLDLVEHFSRMLEEKDIELGFLQKSARGEDIRETADSYYDGVPNPAPASVLTKDFFKKGLFDKQPSFSSDASHPVSSSLKSTPRGSEPPSSARSSVSRIDSETPLSARSVSSAADLVRFEAALEQILPDEDPDAPSAEIDKELFEKFMQEEDGVKPTTPRSKAITPKAHTPRSPRPRTPPVPPSTTTRSPERTPRATSTLTRTPTRSPERTPRDSTPSRTPSSVITPGRGNRVGSTKESEADDTNADSDFDEFAEFAEYQEYHGAEDAIESVDQGTKSNSASRSNSNRSINSKNHDTKNKNNDNKPNNRENYRIESNFATTASSDEEFELNSFRSMASNKSANTLSEDERKLHVAREGKNQHHPVDTKTGNKNKPAELEFGKDLQAYMEMDLQALMNLVNEKYNSGDESDLDADPVDIEALKAQYGFDD